MVSSGRTLLNPRFDHESCGVGFVATLHGDPQHDILRLALTALGRLAHRGAVAADRKSSDGVGILTAVPRELLLKQTGIALTAEQPLAVGMLFLPQQEPAASRDAQRFRECISAHGLQWLAWRDVPIRREILGELASIRCPIIRQALITVPKRTQWTSAELEHRLYLARKAFERETQDTYVCSLSTQTIVYKAMCAGRSLHEFYPDLDSEDYVTPSPFFISDTRPTCCRRGIARSPCACWRTTARSTPFGAIAHTWRPVAPPCRESASPSSATMLPIR